MTRDTEFSRAERLSWALAASALVGFSLAHSWFGFSHSDMNGHAVGSDDAFITFRYVENLLAGAGLTFNGGERVEGFTNLGYLLLCIPGYALLGRDGVLAWAIGINLIAALKAAHLVASWLRRTVPTRMRTAVPWVIALQPTLWMAVASGLETPFVVLAQVALWRWIEKAEREQPTSRVETLSLVAIGVFSVLIRADGFVPMAFGVLYLVLRKRFGPATILATAVVTAFAAVVAFRLAYFGDPLPNTYYAKLSAPFWMRVPAGALQLLIVATQQGFAPELVLLGVGWYSARREGSGLPSFGIFFGTLVVAYWIWVGGDVFQERFLVAVYLIGSALIVDRIAEQDAAPKGAPWLALVCALVLAHLAPTWFDLRFRYSIHHSDRWVALGRHLRDHSDPDALLAVDAAGKIPFFSGLRAVDMLGLNDRELAHRERDRFDVGHDAYDPDYILRRRPDWIACWIDPDLDMFYGLEHEKWSAAGYRLRYLVFADQGFFGGTEIVEAERIPEGELPSLIRAGFRYGVLGRGDRAE